MKEKTDDERKIKVALTGNPNCGKSTLFNSLTGLNQSTGNFPGVTVDKKTGELKIKNTSSNKSTSFEIIDLPGAYSLNPKSIDETVACDVLCNDKSEDHPDITVIVADATNLKRNLFFATQVIELKAPTVLVLNMIDLAEKKGIEIDADLLSKYLGIKVIKISARKNKGIDELKELLVTKIEGSDKKFVPSNLTLDRSQQTIERYKSITSILNECEKKEVNSDIQKLTSRLDKVFTHKIWGYFIFIIILALIFQSIFYLANFPMQWIELLFEKISIWGEATLPSGELSGLIINGILAGLSGVVVFVPQIALLFAFIAILEDTGYMARVSFIMDKLMRKFGLNGKSVIPLISGVACAVPAIMSARTISNWKERMVTIMVTPLMSCSARLPVYTLLISLVIPAEKRIGFFNAQGLILMGLYLIGFIAAIGSAWVMKFFIRSKEKSYFIMEMPIYRTPRWSSIGIAISNKVRIFLFDAGKVIIAISIILWVLSSHGPSNKFELIDAKYKTEETIRQLSAEEIKVKVASEKLENSYAGIIGKSIEPAIRPLGFDWKIGIALITSFVAREVFVGTIATIYSVGNADNTQSIREKMLKETTPEGFRTFTPAVGISLMLFYAFAMQCMSTFAVVYSETKKWKWPILQFLYMGALAYLSSFLIYHFLK